MLLGDGESRRVDTRVTLIRWEGREKQEPLADRVLGEWLTGYMEKQERDW